MPKQFTRSTSGALRYDTFQEPAAWTLGANTSLHLSPALIAAQRSPIPALTPTPGGSDEGGVRESNVYVEGGANGLVWYHFYGAGDNSGNGPGAAWRPHMAYSENRGLTWTKEGGWNIGVNKTSNPADGAWAARDVLQMTKYGSKYHLHAMYATDSFDGGVPAGNYHSDLFTADNPFGPWTFVRGVVSPDSVGFDSAFAYASSQVLYKNFYYQVYNGYNGEGQGIGLNIAIAKATVPEGPWTKEANQMRGFPGMPENPKVFFHFTLGKWVVITNETNPALGSSDKNRITFLDDLDNAEANTTAFVQRVCPSDGSVAIGLISPMYRDEGMPIVEADGTLPATFDADTPDINRIHRGRSIFWTSLTPCPKSLYYAGTNSTLGSALFEDTFNRANGAPGGNWTAVLGAASPVDNNMLLLSYTGGEDRRMTEQTAQYSDAVVTFDLALADDCSAGLMIRWTSNTNFYLLDIQNNNLGFGTWRFTLLVANGGALQQVDTLYTSIIPTTGANANINAGLGTVPVQVYVDGTTLSVACNGKYIGVFNIPALPTNTGYFGTRSGGQGDGERYIDNFRIHALPAPAAESVSTSLITHGDFVGEMALDYTRAGAAGYALFQYRQQANGDCYRVKVTPWGRVRLERKVSGTVTALGSAQGTVVAKAGYMHRIRVEAFGTSHKVYFDGELQVDLTDSTQATGTRIAFGGAAMNVQFRYLKMHTGREVQVTGVPAGRVVTLRGAGGLPLATQTAAGGAVTFPTIQHEPKFVEVDGEDWYSPSRIYGGDVLAYTPASLPGAAVRTGSVVRLSNGQTLPLVG